MWKIEKPSTTAEESFRKSISRVRDVAEKKRLDSIISLIVQAELEYREAAEKGELHTIKEHDGVGGVVTTAEMVSTYTDRFSKNSGPGREIYDDLMLMPKHSKCPLCGHRKVSTLDHVLAKTTHPILAVTPLNLVASCKDCNTEKSSKFSENQDEQFMHPYFDNMDDETWLACDLVDDENPYLTFHVLPPIKWSPTTYQRAVYHFKKLKLEELYLVEAASELESIKQYMEELFDEAGEDEVRLHLLGCYRSRFSARKNSWQTALYGAISNSSWYYSGGFRTF